MSSGSGAGVRIWHAPGPSLLRRRTRRSCRHRPAHRRAARCRLRRRGRAPAVRHPQHDPAAGGRTPTSRSSRCSTTPRPTRRRSARPCAPAPPSAAAGSAGSSPSTTSPRSSSGSAASRRPATGTAPTAPSCSWKQIGVNGLIADPQLPFFIEWDVPDELHPSAGADERFSLACLEIAGDPQRVSEWLGETVEAPLEDVKVDWVAPHGTPGILAVQVQTPNGLVRI